MLALRGTYQNGKVVFDNPLPINKKMKVIVTFVDEDFAEYDKLVASYINQAPTQEKTEQELKESPLLQKFSFLKSIEATKDTNCSFSDALIEERRTEQ